MYRIRSYGRKHSDNRKITKKLWLTCKEFLMLFVGMSNFESLGHSSRSLGGDKHPLKRVEPAVRKFVTVLRIDIDRLQKHKQNIVKVICHANELFTNA